MFDECSLRICVKTTRHPAETENKHLARTLSDDKLTFITMNVWQHIIVTCGDDCDINDNGAFVSDGRCGHVVIKGDNVG